MGGARGGAGAGYRAVCGVAPGGWAGQYGVSPAADGGAGHVLPRQAVRLDTPEGSALCRRRSATAEPVFAQLFARLGRRLNHRGTKADLELHLWAASHNFLQPIRAPRRTRQR